MTSTFCTVCNEALTDAQSIKRRIGPVCAKKLETFIAAGNTSAEELASLALLPDPTVARWLRCISGAIADGRLDRAAMFLQSARRMAEIVRREQEERAA